MYNKVTVLLQQVVKVVQTLADLPDGEPRSQSFGQLDALLDRLERRVENYVFSVIIPENPTFTSNQTAFELAYVISTKFSSETTS